jgi:hypothetical protein
MHWIDERRIEMQAEGRRHWVPSTYDFERAMWDCWDDLVKSQSSEVLNAESGECRPLLQGEPMNMTVEHEHDWTKVRKPLYFSDDPRYTTPEERGQLAGYVSVIACLICGEERK